MLFILFKYLKYCLISFQPDFGKGLLREKRRANKSIMNLSTFFGLTKLKHLTKENDLFTENNNAKTNQTMGILKVSAISKNQEKRTLNAGEVKS